MSEFVVQRPIFQLEAGAGAVMRSSDLTELAKGSNVVLLPGALIVVLPNEATPKDLTEASVAITTGSSNRKPDSATAPRTL